MTIGENIVKEDWSDLEKFSKKHMRNGKKTISINKHVITFSVSFIRQLNIDPDSLFLTIGFSKKNKAIHFEIRDHRTEDSIKMHLTSSSCNISASSFYTMFGIDSKKHTGKYNPEKTKTGWAIYLDKNINSES